jgi:hypothetical protein
MFVLLFGVGAALMVNRIGRGFFRVMSSIVSIGSLPTFLGLEGDCRNCFALHLKH